MKMLSRIDLQLLELVKAGLWGVSPDSSLFSSDVDWKSIYTVARRQSVLGVAYDGILLLPVQLQPTKKILLSWFVVVQQIERMNRKMNQGIVDLIGRLQVVGLQPLLLKGQGLAQYYRNSLHRQPGDIDLFFFDRYDEAIAWAASLDGVKFHPDTTYHRSFEWQGNLIEIHSQYVDFYHSYNKKIWKDLQKSIPLSGDAVLKIEDSCILIPAAQMNVLYVFLHLMHHFLQVGVGLRQVCDWACLFKAVYLQIDKDIFKESLYRLGMLRPASALAFVLVKYLGVQEEVIPLDISSKRTQHDALFMLQDILRTGNFGHDTVMMKNFRRGRFWRNIPSYIMALRRHAKLYALCPREVRAYPIKWFMAKFKKQ